MIDRIIPLIIVIALLCVGFIVSRKKLLRVLERREFLHEFADRFMRYVESGGADERLYAQLTERAVRLQREMQGYGIMAWYRPPFASYAFRDYQIIVNLLPEYRQAATSFGLDRYAAQFADAIRDALLRYLAALEELEGGARKDFRDPLAWLRESVRAILATPFRLLTSLGILSPSVGVRIIASRIMGVASGLVVLVGLLAGAVQIITGWDTTVAIVTRWLARP